MEKKKVVPAWVSVVLLVLSISGIVYYVYDMLRLISIQGFSSVVVMYPIAVISFALAIIYCVMGYKKNAAGIFRAYCIAMTVGILIVFVPYLVNLRINSVMFYDLLIQCGILFVLSIAKDLGKKKSLCFCGILLLLQVISTVMMAKIGAYMAVGSAVGIVNYVILFIMVYAKYADKAARGTK